MENKNQYDARGSLSATTETQVSASHDPRHHAFCPDLRDRLMTQKMNHDPATCWWCQRVNGQLTPCAIRDYAKNVTDAIDARRFSGHRSPFDEFVESIR